MMHPRNIYNTPPNFSELKDEFPEFAAKIHIDIIGKIKLDFKDPEAVRVLSKCCLKKDFNLNVELPPDKLLPTLPLRINYILWIEDILNFCGMKSNIVGVDIGTGASCIYCLLSLRMNSSWKMYALEIDKQNIQYANDNIARNNLVDQIELIDQEENDKMFEKLFTHDSAQKSFTICNPPFFSSNHELKVGENRSGNRKRPHSTLQLKASSETVFSDGGELGFVTKILDESMVLKDKIEIYSSMFGCKRNFQSFISILKKREMESFTTTELVQGKVIRWAVAWSFSRNLINFKDHTKLKDVKMDKKSNVLTHTFDNADISIFHDKLMDILSKLEMTARLVKEEKDTNYHYEIKAVKDTWSNQRRKKRAEKRNESLSSSSLVSQLDLLMGLEISKNITSVCLKIFYLSGSMSRDCVNQILQYIKNHFK